MLGIVVRFDERKDYGFIKSMDDNESYFAHGSEVQDTDEPVLVEGEKVQFAEVTDPMGRLQAKKIGREEIRCFGEVRQFDKGYGFIIPADGSPEVFVHHSDIATPGYKRLEEGEKVSFVVVTEPERQGRKAILVSAVGY